MIPYRLDIAGSWGDHPFMNAVYPTNVISASIKEDDFKQGGLSSSTRNTAKRLWKDLPRDEQSAKTLFFEDNKNKHIVSGSQDSIGLLIPGVKLLNYSESYWPNNIEKINRSQTNWLEKLLWVVPTIQRPKDLNVLGRMYITKKDVKTFSDQVSSCWEGITEMNALKVGHHMTESFKTRCKIMPNCINPELGRIIHRIVLDNDPIGHKLCGAGGGGYLLLLSKNEIKGGKKIKIRK